jgi:hypothetical protein
MSERNIKEDLKINRFKLEIECEQQPDLYHYHAEKLAMAKKIKDEAKDNLKRVEAKIQLKVRSGEIEPDVKKTENSIAAIVVDNAEVEKARKELIEAEYEMNLLAANEESMRQRKSMLDHLIQLYIKEYYSAPKERNDGNDLASNNLRKNLNKGV